MPKLNLNTIKKLQEIVLQIEEGTSDTISKNATDFTLKLMQIMLSYYSYGNTIAHTVLTSAEKRRLRREMLKYADANPNLTQYMPKKVPTNKWEQMNWDIWALCWDYMLLEDIMITDAMAEFLRIASETLETELTSIKPLDIDGLTYHSRLAIQSNHLSETVSQKIGVFMMSGASPRTAEAELKRYTERSYRQRVKRIQFTEDTFLINEVMKEYSGAKKYSYKTAEDNKVCEICMALSGQVYSYDNAIVGVNFPPLHPWCRCMAIPI